MNWYKRGKNMVKKSLFEFFRYTSLNVLGMIGLSCYILADTFFVSQGIGTDGLTALNLAIPIYSFIHGSGLMIGMGGATKYSILKSQEHHQGANKIFTHVLCLAGCFALIFVLIGIFLSGTIISLFVDQGHVFDMSKTYLQVILLFAPAFLLNNVLLCFVRNDGAPQLSMAAMLGGSFSNIILDYIFIFPCQMGIFGAVFATGLAPIISMIILSSHFLCKHNQFYIQKCQIQLGRIVGILSTGIPSLVTEVSSGVVMIVFNAIILRLTGNVGVSAYGVVANLSLVIMAIYTGITQGIQPLMSRDYGLNDWGNIQRILKYALITMLVLSAVIYACIFLEADVITQIFNSENNAELQTIASQGLKLYFIACPFAGFNIIVAMYLTSIEHPYPAQMISILRGFIIIIPMAFLLSQIAQMNGVWCSFPISELIVTTLSCVMMMKIRK